MTPAVSLRHDVEQVNFNFTLWEAVQSLSFLSLLLGISCCLTDLEIVVGFSFYWILIFSSVPALDHIRSPPLSPKYSLFSLFVDASLLLLGRCQTQLL